MPFEFRRNSEGVAIGLRLTNSDPSLSGLGHPLMHLFPRVAAKRRNPGLELANAFGVLFLRRALRKSASKFSFEVPQPIDGLNVLEQNLEPKPPANF